ncbi:CD59 glycoprotein [Lates calcarifer]|uniref:CD59 glycoprotein n=1 Tax=Lates calcarifer TaxID=8187 RepID=A0A4W6C3G5_LATCA|nr:CD59 glycoprotein [Lates calcarifer]
MQLYGVLAILFMTLSTAYGLRCYTCTATTPKSCTLDYNCPAHLNRCSSLNENGLITKGCQNSNACVKPLTCCEGDLCNSATPADSSFIPTGPSVILLLVSSAIIPLFI